MLERGSRSDVEALVDLLEGATSPPARVVAQVRAKIAAAQAAGALRVVREDGRVVAGFVLTEAPDSIGRAAVLRHLSFARSHTGADLAARVLAGAEREARALGCETVRLDCPAANIRLVRIYQSLGYFPRGVRTTLEGLRLFQDKRVTRLAESVAVASLDDVDFEDFRADDVATLCFVVDGDRVLLIDKKRGHGAGKVNGPGGKVEVGESAHACARRETCEEVGVDPLGVECRAELRFQDTNGYAMLGFAFVADRHRGEPVETDEARPFWCEIEALPFATMWDDDRLWLPRILDGDSLVGEFLIHGDRLVAHRLRPESPVALSLRSRRVHCGIVDRFGV
jgi:8-oxo-dGTP diphosphatase